MNQKYSLSMRIAHWVIALFIIALLRMGFWMSELPDDAPGKWDYYAFHKSLGITLFLLMLARLLIRFSSKVPDFPAQLKTWEKKLASSIHSLFYIVILLMPISGYLGSCFGGHKVDLFGLPIPLMFEKNKDIAEFFGEAHEVLAYTILFLIALHLLGIIKHQVVDRINLLKRMV